MMQKICLSKKDGQAVFFVAAFLFFVSVCFFLNSYPAYAKDTKTEAKILFSSGKVEIKSSSSGGWAPAKKGAFIDEGTEIRTSEESACELTIGSGINSVIKLKADSQAALRSFSPVKIYLKSGNLVTLVRGLKKGDIFEVITPTAVASARGAGWAQSLKEIHVFEGTVYLIGPKGQEIAVSEGKKVKMTKDEVIISSVDFSSALKEEWSEFKNTAEGFKKILSMIDRPQGGDKKEKRPGQLQGIASLERPTSNEPYKILSLTSNRPEDATYYNILTKKSAILLMDMELIGDYCLVCAKEHSEITVKPVLAPFESRRVIEGPVSGILSELYYSAADASRQKYSQTIIAVQEGAVLASIIMRVGNKEIIVSSTLIRGDAEEKAPEDLDKNWAPNRKAREKTKKASDLINQLAFKKGPNVMVIDPCGYVKVLYIAHLNLTINCAENIQQGLTAVDGKPESTSADCSGKGPNVNTPPLADPLA